MVHSDWLVAGTKWLRNAQLGELTGFIGVLSWSPHSVKEGDPRKCGTPPELFIWSC